MLERPSDRIPFMKMHGLGNDFIVFDARNSPIQVTKQLVLALADRRTGIGCDQIALIEEGPYAAHLRFWNSDGSPSATCGNATRCIAHFLMVEAGTDSLTLTTENGQIDARDFGAGLTAVNMGSPKFDWENIPLSQEADTLALPIAGEPVATDMGNPHCTFFVEDAEAVVLEEFGPRYENHPLFPQRTNVQVASPLDRDRFRVRVWERGAGLTRASGSSSCAVAVAAARRGIASRSVDIVLDGGTLKIDWAEDGVWMTGPTCHVSDGVLTPEFLAGLV